MWKRASCLQILARPRTCGAFLKSYAHLLEDRPNWADRAAALSSRVRDVSEYMQSIAGEVPLGALAMRVTYQDPCHLAHAQGIRTESRTLLSKVKGLELIEMAGFTAEVPGNVDPALYHPSHKVSSGVFSDTVPSPIAGPNGSPPDSFDASYSIRQKVLDRFNANAEYVSRFQRIYPEARGGQITFAMIGAALAEFEIANTFANAPLDRFARGHRHALTEPQQHLERDQAREAEPQKESEMRLRARRRPQPARHHRPFGCHPRGALEKMPYCRTCWQPISGVDFERENHRNNRCGGDGEHRFVGTGARSFPG